MKAKQKNEKGKKERKKKQEEEARKGKVALLPGEKPWKNNNN